MRSRTLGHLKIIHCSEAHEPYAGLVFRHRLHGELLVRGARPRLRGVLESLSPPRVVLAVPRVAHVAGEPVVSRRPAVPASRSV